MREAQKRDCEQLRQPFHDVALQLFGPAPTSPEAGRMYARAPLASGLRSEVDLSGLETLVGGAAFKDANSGVWLGTAGNVTVSLGGFAISVYYEEDSCAGVYDDALITGGVGMGPVKVTCKNFHFPGYKCPHPTSIDPTR